MAGILSMVLGTTFQGLTGVVIGASRGEVTRIFTSDPEVLKAVRSVSLLAMAFQVTN